MSVDLEAGGAARHLQRAMQGGCPGRQFERPPGALKGLAKFRLRPRVHHRWRARAGENPALYPNDTRQPACVESFSQTSILSSPRSELRNRGSLAALGGFWRLVG